MWGNEIVVSRRAARKRNGNFQDSDVVRHALIRKSRFDSASFDGLAERGLSDRSMRSTGKAPMFSTFMPRLDSVASRKRNVARSIKEVEPFDSVQIQSAHSEQGHFLIPIRP